MAWDNSSLVRAAWNRGWGVFDSDPPSLRRNESHVFCDAVAFKPVPSDNRSTAIMRESGSIHQHHLPASRNAPCAGPAASGNDLHLQALWDSDCMQLGQVLTVAHSAMRDAQQRLSCFWLNQVQCASAHSDPDASGTTLPWWLIAHTCRLPRQAFPAMYQQRVERQKRRRRRTELHSDIATSYVASRCAIGMQWRQQRACRIGCCAL